MSDWQQLHWLVVALGGDYMRILHMSDLHFGMEKSKKMTEDDIAARDNYMEELLYEVRGIVEQKPVEYIFITGDIAFTAKKEEYDRAAKWIRNLINVCNIPSSAVFLCPGNHDVDREELFDKEVPVNQKKANELLTTKFFVQLSKRFEQYIQFCKDLGVSTYNLGGNENYLVGVTTRADINVVCINTAWFAKNDEYENNMWVGVNFLERIKQDKLFVNNLPTITIMHHPDSAWHQEECSNYATTINVYSEICKISNIVWYGHTHEVKNDHIYKEDAYICGSGAAFENRVYHNNFHVYDIGNKHSSEHNCEKIIYKYSSGEWDKKEKDISINLINKYKNKVWENRKKETSELLDDHLESFIEKFKYQKRLIPLIKNALLMDRETRREVHVLISEANKETRKQFLCCMESLIDFPDEIVRGEAYYCLGELTDDKGHIDEKFLFKGLQDNSDFVKACCANVLHHYIPLEENTLNLLKDEITLYEVAHADINKRKLYYYAKKTVKTHYDYLRLIT